MAIDELLDEHEQGERVQAWLRQNAVGLIGGVVLALALIGGWRWWQARLDQQQVQAGETYQSVLAAITANDLKGAQAKAASLREGTFASLVALDLARAQVRAGQRDAAIASLRRAQAADPALGVLVQRRLARLLVDAGKGAEALKMLAGVRDPAGLEARGDAHLALGDRDAARRDYADALTRLDVASPQRRLLELKLTDAGGTPGKQEARS